MTTHVFRSYALIVLIFHTLQDFYSQGRRKLFKSCSTVNERESIVYNLQLKTRYYLGMAETVGRGGVFNKR